MFVVIMLSSPPFERYLVRYFTTEDDAKEFKFTGEQEELAREQNGKPRLKTYMRIAQELE